jgi:hypothetical protein
MDEQYDLEFHRAMKAAWEKQQADQQEMENHTYAIAVNGADYRLFLQLKQRKGLSTAQMFHILVRNYG